MYVFNFDELIDRIIINFNNKYLYSIKFINLLQ